MPFCRPSRYCSTCPCSERVADMNLAPALRLYPVGSTASPPPLAKLAPHTSPPLHDSASHDTECQLQRSQQPLLCLLSTKQASLKLDTHVVAKISLSCFVVAKHAISPLL